MTAKLLRVREMAAVLNVSESEVYRLVALRRLACMRIGTRILFRPEHIEQFCAENEVPAAGARA